MAPIDNGDAAIDAALRRAMDGDRRSLQELINLIHPQVVRYCRARIPSTKYPTAEDIAQEVCLAVARAIPTYQDKGVPFMAFVYRVAANKIVDARRSHARDLSHPTEEIPDDEAPGITPEEDIILQDSCNDVRHLLDLLNDKAREIVLLRVFGGYTAEETAKILGTSAGAVRVAQFRALAKLREHVQQHTPESTHRTPPTAEAQNPTKQ